MTRELTRDEITLGLHKHGLSDHGKACRCSVVLAFEQARRYLDLREGIETELRAHGTCTCSKYYTLRALLVAKPK